MFKRLAQFFLQRLNVTYWATFDCLLTTWIKLKKLDYVGQYIYIMSKAERELYFSGQKKHIYGYNGFSIIKLGAKRKFWDFEVMIDVLNHEILHQAVGKVTNNSVSVMLDNVHKPYFNSRLNRYVLVFQ